MMRYAQLRWLVLSVAVAVPASGATAVYEFAGDQSTVVQTGGFAGVHETYIVEGSFQLSVDFDAGTAAFDWVDATLSEGPFLHTTDLDELFRMTRLEGRLVDNATLVFTMLDSDHSERLELTATLHADSVELTGLREHMVSDGFAFALNALAIQTDGRWDYCYADDFSTEKARNDSYKHSVFWPENAFGPAEPFLYYSSRAGKPAPGLVFMGYEGKPAVLNYCFPLQVIKGARAVKGTIEFDVLALPWSDMPEPFGSFSYSLSADGEIWTLPIQARQGHNSVDVGSEHGTVYIGFMGSHKVLDNLKVRLASQTATIHVPLDYKTIQSAIDAARDGDIVAVAPGVYREEGNHDIDFMGKAITVTSTGGPEQTVIDLAPLTMPPIDERQNRRGFYFHRGETSRSVLKGFTIRGGRIYGSDIPFHGEPWPASPKNPVGGGIYCEMSSPTIANCVIADCAAEVGGGIGCVGSAASIIDSRIINCKAGGLGGSRSGGFGAGIALLRNSAAAIINCAIQNNEAYYNSLGGGLLVRSSAAKVIGCDISFNGAEGNIYGGGVYVGENSDVVLQNTIVSNNTASTGGGVYAERRAIILPMSESDAPEDTRIDSGLLIRNCTIAHNRILHAMPPFEASGIYSVGVNIRVKNSIVWFNEGLQVQIIDPASNSPVTYSNIEDKYPGPGNISADPLFAPVAVNDYHLQSVVGRYQPQTATWVVDVRHSRSIDAGDPDDPFDREPAPNGRRVNMGAYGNTAEASKGKGNVIYHVDAAAGDDDNDGLSRETALQHIQTAMDRAISGDTILVWPGVYVEAVDYLGKAVVIQSAADAAVIEAPQMGNIKMDAITFHTGEGPDSVLRNFVIRNSGVAISLNYQSSPTLTQLTIVDNLFGIAAYEDSRPDVSNCIFHANKDGDIYGCMARYSLFTSMIMAPYVPLFADYEGGDYHLLSRRGRYRASTDEWVLDKVDSIALDMGDPTIKPVREPMPNGGRLNIGAYGGTAYASMSEWPLKGDLDNDGRTSLADLAIIAEEWLDSLAWTNLRPTVRIVEPYDQASIPFAAETIMIRAEAKDPDGEVVKVEFFANNVTIGEDTDARDGWSVPWWLHSPGNYALTAEATDDDGATVRSRPIHITVVNSLQY